MHQNSTLYVLLNFVLDSHLILFRKDNNKQQKIPHLLSLDQLCFYHISWISIQQNERSRDELIKQTRTRRKIVCGTVLKKFLTQ
ncbi:hypothetical protein BpHYR1_041197 [Brachionus plicatilis]|uniref:Uncharacterized protein n=1 Tax=Brachionus plicatilis TaxID=10195 RepID=A0A3M7T9C2_BRAPC|nr:hypothetical protein BpHYR1_041197 [Brachionus plicatilis]